MVRLIRFLALVTALFLAGCNSSKIKDAIDSFDPPSRKTIDTSKLGVNAFVNDSRFGTISQQFSEVKNTLRINHVRVLMRWDNAVQSSPTVTPNFSFYDDIIEALPAGTDALIVLTGVPQWMYNSANWQGGNPRVTFAERWVRAVVSRYRSNARVVGFQIWNEPNFIENDTVLMGIADNPVNYVEMLAAGYSVAKDLAPSKLVLNAATTAINQNYPTSLNYNRAMRDAGAQNYVDRWAMHYYGKQFENFVRGVDDFLNGLDKPVWVTETGQQGVNEQLAYGEQVWPFLIERVPSIERIYAYQFTEASAPTATYGLRNLSGDFPVSDLYVWLRDR